MASTRWQELPQDLLISISHRLTTYLNYVRFRATCVSWNSALPTSPFHPLKQPLPYLMLPFDDETNKTSRSFYSLLEDKVYPLDFPEIRDRFLRRSSRGWLLIVGLKGPELNLYNPISKEHVSLPPMSSFPEQMQEVFIKRVVLSSDLSSGRYMAAAIYGENSQLAFCRSNDKIWMSSDEIKSYGCIDDVIFHQEKIYAVNPWGELIVSDTIDYSFSQSIKFRKKLHTNMRNVTPDDTKYLVGSNDHGLMLVVRYYSTVKFKIYALDQSRTGKHKWKWSKVTDLGDNVIFIGNGSSVCMSSRNFSKIKGNCIYYTFNFANLDSSKEDCGGFGIGVFRMTKGRIQHIESLNLDGKLVWPSPLRLI